MGLSENFENAGNWLFRWRSYLPLAMYILLLIAMREYEYPGASKALDHLWEVFCIIVCFIGLAVRVLTIGYTPRGTSGRNTDEQNAYTLNTTGAYSIVRNPLYLGNFFMGFGIVLFAHVWWLTLIYILSFWLYYERIIFAEEVYLKKKFGEEFLAWTKKTPAFIPKFRHYRKAKLSFSWRNVLRREYNGLLSVIMSLFLLETVGEYVVTEEISIDLGWIFIVSLATMTWAILRMLRKYTTFLKDEGR